MRMEQIFARPPAADPERRAGEAASRAQAVGLAAIEEAQANIARGDLAEALIWIERAHPGFGGLVRLFERKA